jgi:hypothetical protein
MVFSKKLPSKWVLVILFGLAVFGLRLAFGLFAPPVQPIEDDVQAYLLGLKYFTTGAWPYYGNDVIAPPLNSGLLSQDPGALECMMIGLPFKIWRSPVAPFIFLNLFSMAGLLFLAWYCTKRFPGLSPWFIFSWLLTAPWCIHYTTGIVNLSYSMVFGAFFFVAWMESIPSLSLKWMPPALANLLMGFAFSGWFQFHRTWVLVGPFIALSFFLQWKRTRKITAPVYFGLGFLPLTLLIFPTWFGTDYHFFQYTSAFSYGFKLKNFLKIFLILAQFLGMGAFEELRFIGHHTAERMQFLSENHILIPGLLLGCFGFLQLPIFLGYLFDSKNPRPDWKAVRWILVGTILVIYGSLLLTVKNADVNTYCEMFPVIMIYSFYIWERWWSHRWGKAFLQFFIALVFIFQITWVIAQIPENKSFYLMYQDKIVQAIEKNDYHLVGERRPGCFY